MQFKTYLGEHITTISTGGKRGCQLEGLITEQGSLSHQKRAMWPPPEGCLARGTKPARVVPFLGTTDGEGCTEDRMPTTPTLKALGERQGHSRNADHRDQRLASKG